MQISEILQPLEIEPVNSGACDGEWIAHPSGGELASTNPADGSTIARVRLAGPEDYDRIARSAVAAFHDWRMLPAPRRGDIVREVANELRAFKLQLGALVTLEMGKILAEGQGEVQEMIDIADFAVGLSRQLYGLTMASERPGHRMYEQWHPLGVAGVITAFNFPVAVWSWNALIAAVCGDCVIWKPSPQTPLTAIAVQKICNRVFARHGLKGVFNLAIGSNDAVGQSMLEDRRIPLVSFTGSTPVGRHVAETVARRLGRIILELGGEVLYGGRRLGGCYVEPALVKASADLPIIQEEIFAPILYLIEFDELEQAIHWHNHVPQGLSSAMFTNSLIASETFLSHRGSDCGIANINIGTSGAEIGGAFGGEKDTGGGRESGSDAWKAYMRRQTNTINWSRELPLAQGIEFKGAP